MNLVHRRRATAIAILLITVGIASAACRAETNADEVSQAQVAASIDQSSAPLLLDVRTPAEYASGHVPGAVNIPHDQLASRVSELDASPDRDIVVYCERGGRAATARATLEAAGFTAIRHLAGDMSEWRNAGLPTRAGGGDRQESRR